jgi:hypothetical protein
MKKSRRLLSTAVVVDFNLLLLLLLLLSSTSKALLCDPTICDGLVPPDPSSQAYVCDLSCHPKSQVDAIPIVNEDDGTTIPASDTGCQSTNLCRLCRKTDTTTTTSTTRTTTTLKSCRLARLDNYIHAIARLSEIPTVTTAVDALVELTPVVEQFFDPNNKTSYTIASVGTFQGYAAQIEYLTTTQPASNFEQYHFVKSRVLGPVTTTAMNATHDRLTLNWEVTAKLGPYNSSNTSSSENAIAVFDDDSSGKRRLGKKTSVTMAAPAAKKKKSTKTFTGVQPTVLTYDKSKNALLDHVDRVADGQVQLDFLNFVIPLALQLPLTSDATVLCGLIDTYCDAQGYDTGYNDFSDPASTANKTTTSRSSCARALQKKDITYYATLAPRLIQQLIVDKNMNSIATLSEDNSICRSIHVILAQIDPATHCPHVALDSTYCITAAAA